MATLKRNNCLHSADEETEPHMLADVVLGILTPSLGLLPLYDVSLLFLLNIHSNAATLPLAGNSVLRTEYTVLITVLDIL